MTQPAKRRDVLELKRELEAARDELVARGVCGCSCGAELVGRWVDAEGKPTRAGEGDFRAGGNGRGAFINVKHRQRFRRRLLKRLAEASGVPSNLSVRSLHATDGTAERNGDAQRPGKRPPRPPRPGVSIYLPSLEDAQALDAALEALDAPELEDTREALAKALERRRKRARRSGA